MAQARTGNARRTLPCCSKLLAAEQWQERRQLRRRSSADNAFCCCFLDAKSTPPTTNAQQVPAQGEAYAQSPSPATRLKLTPTHVTNVKAVVSTAGRRMHCHALFSEAKAAALQRARTLAGPAEARANRRGHSSQAGGGGVRWWSQSTKEGREPKTVTHSTPAAGAEGGSASSAPWLLRAASVLNACCRSCAAADAPIVRRLFPSPPPDRCREKPHPLGRRSAFRPRVITYPASGGGAALLDSALVQPLCMSLCNKRQGRSRTAGEDASCCRGSTGSHPLPAEPPPPPFLRLSCAVRAGVRAA